MFSRKPKILLDLETDPNIKILGTYTNYHALLERRLKYLQDTLQQFKSKHLAMINKNCTDFQYNSGDFVYIISPLTNQLGTNLRKVSVKYIGPLVIYKIVNPHNYLLMTLNGKIQRALFKHERLKLVIIRTSYGNVINLVQLKQVLTPGLVI